MLTGADRFLSARCLCFRRPLLLALWCLWKRNVHERQKAKRKQVICDLHQLTALYVMHITLHKVRLRPSECMPKTILLRPFHLTSIRYDDLKLRSPALYMHKRYILIDHNYNMTYLPRRQVPPFEHLPSKPMLSQHITGASGTRIAHIICRTRKKFAIVQSRADGQKVWNV